MPREEKEKFLRKKGWSTWYNDNYWVHEKTIADPSRQDHTNYGMSLEEAYNFEVNNEPPFEAAYGCMRMRGGEIYLHPVLA